MKFGLKFTLKNRLYFGKIPAKNKIPAGTGTKLPNPGRDPGRALHTIKQMRKLQTLCSKISISVVTKFDQTNLFDKTMKFSMINEPDDKRNVVKYNLLNIVNKTQEQRYLAYNT